MLWPCLQLSSTRPPPFLFFGGVWWVQTLILFFFLFQGFEKFVKAAEAWPVDVQYDIVEGFLRSSSECSEIFLVLEAGKRKVQEVGAYIIRITCPCYLHSLTLHLYITVYRGILCFLILL